MKSQVLFILLIIFTWKTVLSMKYVFEETKNKDVQVSINDNFTIAAFNSEKFYLLYFSSNRLKNSSYRIAFEHHKDYVYSISGLTMKKDMIVSFVQIMKTTSSRSAVLRRLTIDLTNLQSYRTDTDLKKIDHEYFLLKVDPQEKYAYIFTASFILSYNLLTDKIDQMIEMNITDCDGYKGSFNPYAFDLTNQWAAVVGLHQNKPCLHIFGLQPLNLIETRSIDRNDVTRSNRFGFNRNSFMSVSINPSGTTIAIGQGSLDMVVIACMNDNNISTGISQMFKITEDTESIGFGRSVTWLDDQGTLAILLDKSLNRHSSTSQIQVYKQISCHIDPGTIIPDFVLPNHQQTLHRIGNVHDKMKYYFLSILARSGNLLILRNDARLIYIPSASVGFCSMEPLGIAETRHRLLSNNTFSAHVYHMPVMEYYASLERFPSKIKPNDNTIIYTLQSKPCVSGTYKNTTSIGPCTVCPPGTKNPGGKKASSCQKCVSTTVCPLGATNEGNLENFPSTNQIFNYPDSPLIDNYDDILLLNFIPNTWKFACIASSPLFISILCIILSIIVWSIMLLIKRRQPTRLDTYRKQAKVLLKHTDLIREGEQLAGGLASIVVFAIILYSILFAIYYFFTYSSANVSFRAACEDNQRNVKFDNALQLPLPERDGNDWKIFKLLNEQKFNLTVKLINTAARCNHITVQQNKLRGYPENQTNIDCNYSNADATISFSFPVPTHTSSLQINITGPYFIGALRFCLHGFPSNLIDEKENHLLKELNVCKLFYTHNETIGLTTDFNVDLIKVINVTKPLLRYQSTNYSGIWKPIIKCLDDLSEEFYYARHGAYLRYASDQITFTLTFREENYFLQNNQSPIIRRAAIIFHTCMFIFLFIDMIAMIFVLYKLWGHPLIKRIFRSCENDPKNEVSSKDCDRPAHSPLHVVQLSDTNEINHRITETIPIP